ncbi:MAG: phosphoglucosamine mutase [Roseburia sp.]|nr:hypothetical protein [Anaeroplasma bactoclasticum]MCM1195981.1 phosphoglucosamine mutase [Roseburia sp.]MCM1556407.1 hypothetical protein [Anaeroplasma bactoclasticum]
MKYFGTDGIRGIPNQKLNLKLIISVGKALSALNCSRLIVGTDTRESKDMIATALIAGALSLGFEVDYVGVIPTPGLVFLSKVEQAIGVMITASHNPFFYNGIKIIHKGRKLKKEEEEEIEAYINQPPAYGGSIGKLIHSKALLKEYHRMLFQHIYPTNMKIAIDCANGATYKTAPLIFNLITNSLVTLHNHPNGVNINEKCGSTHLESLSTAVIENQCDLGIAFDGDGDRILCVDKNGVAVDGDVLLYIFTSYLKEKNQLKNNRVALSIMSNLGILQALRKKGIEVIETAVGDKYILKAIEEYDISIGGENSGHIIMPEISSTGDGILIAMKLLQVLEETHTTLEDWLKEIVLYPDALQNVIVKDKEKVMGIPLQKEIELIKKELNQDCKIIVRPSGTEECLRLSVMAKTQELVDQYKNKLLGIIKSLDALQ